MSLPPKVRHLITLETFGTGKRKVLSRPPRAFQPENKTQALLRLSDRHSGNERTEVRSEARPITLFASGSASRHGFFLTVSDTALGRRKNRHHEVNEPLGIFASHFLQIYAAKIATYNLFRLVNVAVFDFSRIRTSASSVRAADSYFSKYGSLRSPGKESAQLRVARSSALGLGLKRAGKTGCTRTKKALETMRATTNVAAQARKTRKASRGFPKF